MKGRRKVGATADSEAETSPAVRLGFKPGQLVHEFGWDEDTDDELRASIEDVTGHEMGDEDVDEVADVILYWFRDEDGDLVDALVDALANLAEGGVIWLLTPKNGRAGHIEASDIEESAPTAGLHATSSVSACRDWSGTRLSTPRGGRR